jgi:RNA polymerase sigma-70 factor (ECF subfamily)
MSEELLHRIRAGDRGAFDLLYLEYGRPAFGAAYNILRNAAEAEDVVQETFVAVYRSIHQLREPAAFKGWMFRILVNTAKRRMRDWGRERDLKSALKERPQEPARDKGVDDKVKRIRDAVDEFLDAVNPEDRVVFTLGLMERMPHDEIAEVTGMTVEAVRSRLYRIRKRFKEYWNRAHAVQ